MCKGYVAAYYKTDKGELDNIEDLRVHADMFPTDSVNMYRACLSGIRR